MHTSCVDVHSGQLPGVTWQRLKVWTRSANSPIVPICHEANATRLMVVSRYARQKSWKISIFSIGIEYALTEKNF